MPATSNNMPATLIARIGSFSATEAITIEPLPILPRRDALHHKGPLQAASGNPSGQTIPGGNLRAAGKRAGGTRATGTRACAEASLKVPFYPGPCR